MSILHALIDQIIFTIFTLICLYPSRNDLPDSFYRIGIYILLIMLLAFGTWLRWYLQMPLMGAIGYLFV